MNGHFQGTSEGKKKKKLRKQEKMLSKRKRRAEKEHSHARDKTAVSRAEEQPAPGDEINEEKELRPLLMRCFAGSTITAQIHSTFCSQFGSSGSCLWSSDVMGIKKQPSKIEHGWIVFQKVASKGLIQY